MWNVRQRTLLGLPRTNNAVKGFHSGLRSSVKGLLDYAIKIAATWVACKKLHARIARPFTLRIQHRAIFKKSFSDWIFNSVSVIVCSNL